MIRRAFTMRLKPGSSAEYEYQHDNIWPELAAQIERSGIATITTFRRDLDLFLVSEITDEAAWDRLWNSEIHKRWAEVMRPLMDLRDDGIVETEELVEVFHFKANGNGELIAVESVSTFEEADSGNGALAELVATEDAGNVAAEITSDPLAELIAETSGEPGAAPAEPLAEPAQSPSAPPVEQSPRKTRPRRTKRAMPKPPAKKPKARKSKRKAAKKGRARSVSAARKKKTGKKRVAKKKKAARKAKPRKTAKKKAAKKRGRK